MPHHIQSPAALPYLRSELELFKRSIEDRTGKKTADKDLDRGIDMMKANRRLMREVYEFKKGDKVSVTGLDAMEIVVSSQMTDKAANSRELQKSPQRHPGESQREKRWNPPHDHW